MKLVALLLAGIIPAADHEIPMPAELQQACKDEGGCTLYTSQALKARMECVFREGRESGKTACKGET